jgi:hypothetical protein
MKLNHKWLVAVSGTKRDVPVVEGVDILYNEDFEYSAPEFFNYISNLSGYDYVICLGRGYNITDTNSYEVFQKYTEMDCIQAFGALYSDLRVIDEDGGLVCSQYKPAYDIKLKNKGLLLNIPFISSMKNLPTFDTRVKHLYLWDALLTISSAFLLFHMPHELFTINNALESLSIDEDVKHIQGRHFAS